MLFSNGVKMMIEADLVPPLINTLCHGEFKTQKQAAFAVGNAIITGTKEQVGGSVYSIMLFI